MRVLGSIRVFPPSVSTLATAALNLEWHFDVFAQNNPHKHTVMRQIASHRNFKWDLIMLISSSVLCSTSTSYYQTKLWLINIGEMMEITLSFLSPIWQSLRQGWPLRSWLSILGVKVRLWAIALNTDISCDLKGYTCLSLDRQLCKQMKRIFILQTIL